MASTQGIQHLTARCLAASITALVTTTIFEPNGLNQSNRATIAQDISAPSRCVRERTSSLSKSLSFLGPSFHLAQRSRTLCEAGHESTTSQRQRFTESLLLPRETEKHEDKRIGTRSSIKSIEGDVYPNFSRHGKNCLLPKYLTPKVFEQLKTKQTANGVRLEDIIRGGVALPWGACPPRGLAGVYAGDAESYHTFSALFLPLIDNYHRARNRVGRRLQRHQSNLNFNQLLRQQLDPEGEYILYTRMRLARSIQGFRFAPCIGRQERREIEQLIKTCVQEFETGQYISLMEMTNSQHDDLMQRRLLFTDPDEFAISAGLGRDWPDGRGLYCDNWQVTPTIMIWCNGEDHVWIISNAKGGDVQGVFTKLSQVVLALETALQTRGHHFIEDRKLGFLNTSPANIGTALRASVYVKLVRLSRQPGFSELVKRLRLEAKTEYGESDKRFTGIYDIANLEALGKSEVDLINIMIRGVGILIDLEKRLERGEELTLSTIEVKT